MSSTNMYAKYIRRVGFAFFIALTVGLVIHAAIKYRRLPFGIGSTSYRLARSSNYYPDEFIGGFYQAGGADKSRGDSAQSATPHGRSIENFCLDGSPLPPSTTFSSGRTEKFTTASNTPSYHILNSNFTMTESLDAVARTIKEKYNDLLKMTLNNRAAGTNCRPKVIEYRCAGDAQSKCGGFGDRLRGMAASFFMALLTNSVFSLNWDYPVNLEAYFEPAFVSRQQLIEQLYSQEPSEIVIHVIDEEEDIIWLLSDITRLRHIFMKFDVIAFEINSLVPLEVLLSHPYFRSLAAYYDITNFSYSEIFSIALRILLPHYTPRLADAVAPYDTFLQSPIYDASFGLQIRLGSPAWHEVDRVSLPQIRCFVDEVKNISDTNGYKHLLIFVTADSNVVVNEVSRLVGKLFDGTDTSAKVITAEDIANISHIDRTSFSRHQGVESAALRTFADWAILAAREMDHLIISRSSFGETAGLLHMSAKSIRRLAHNITDACVFHDYAMTSVWMEAGAISTYTSLSNHHRFLIVVIVAFLFGK